MAASLALLAQELGKQRVCLQRAAQEFCSRKMISASFAGELERLADSLEVAEQDFERTRRAVYEKRRLLGYEF